MFDFLNRLRSNGNPPVDLELLSSQIEEGRKLAIYDRETGLYAFWYLALRGGDECNRAQRYDWPLTLAVVQIEAGENAWALQGVVTDWLRLQMRDVDITGYAGNGRFVVLMPNTDAAGAETLLSRLDRDVRDVALAFSGSPADGADFESLYAVAQARLLEAHKAS